MSTHSCPQRGTVGDKRQLAPGGMGHQRTAWHTPQHKVCQLPPTCCVASCLTSTEANREMAEGGSRQDSTQPGPPYGCSDGMR